MNRPPARRKPPDVPDDLLAFLRAGRQLRYKAADCEAGRVTLFTPDKLREVVFDAQTYGTPAVKKDPHRAQAGTYGVTGIDLVAKCGGGYDPDGLLVWFHGEQRYGTVDTSHDYVLLFARDVRWADIVAAPVRYLNAQWAFEDEDVAPTEYLEPWHRYPWKG
jgi:hypothetical protein